MTQECPLLPGLSEASLGWKKEGILKPILVAPAEGAMLYAAISTHCPNQSWISPGVTKDGNSQRGADLGEGQHAGALQPGLRHMPRAQRRAVHSAGVPGFRRGVRFHVAKSAAFSVPQREEAVPHSVNRLSESVVGDGPFFDWVIYFSGVELEEMLVYFTFISCTTLLLFVVYS